MEPGFHAIDSDWCRIAFERAPAPLVVCDSASLRVLGANACASATYGYGPGEWAGTDLLDLFEAADHGRVRAAVAAAARDGEAQLPALAHIGKDGACLHCQLQCYRLACTDGSAEAPPVLLAMQDHSDAAEAEARLAHLQDVLTVSQEVTGLGCCTMNLTTARLTWSAQQYRNLGLEPASVMPSMERLLAPVHAGERPAFALAIERCILDGQPFDTSLHLSWPDGSEHVLRASGRRISGGPGSPDWFACATVDISAECRLRDQLLQTESDLQHAQEIAHIGTWAADLRTGLIETTSAETYRIFRIDPGRNGHGGLFTLDQLFRRIHPDDVAGVAAAREHTLKTPGARYDHRYRIVEGDNQVRYVHSQADVVRDEDGQPVRIVGIIRDVTDITRAEQEIERLAFCDELTGLPNRVAMCRYLDTAFDESRGLEEPVAVLTVALARFREINLTLGHLNGDDLLRDVARRLRAELGEDVHLARTGNAQFIAVLRGVRAYNAGAVAETIARVFDTNFLIAGVRYEISAQVGIAVAPGHARNPSDLLRKADVAVYQARQNGRKTMMYDPAQDPYDPQRLALLGQFRNAVAEGQIELYCQPKVAMATGAVIGAEALARWHHPQLGMVPPGEFVPLIESTELIHALTSAMLHAAVRQSHAWRQEGLALPIAVNLSTRNLISGALPGDLRALLAGWDADPGWLGLEITESSLIADPDATIAQLQALSNMGFRLFIDDFGTGYSSLNYLTMLPVDVIKIDHGFTTNMLRDRRAGAIVKATIDLAHDLGLSVVAEGAATREIWDALLAAGCDEAQGYYVAPPLPAQELPGWMRQHALRCRHAGVAH